MRTLLLWFCGMTLFSCALRAEDVVPVRNDLGVDVRAFYGHARGHTPWPLTEMVKSGSEADIEREKLRVCRRLILDTVSGDGAGSSVYQFFTPFSLEDVDDMLVVMRKFSERDDDSFPFLVTTFDGDRIGFAGGLTFSILTSHIEEGMTRETWDEYLNPLANNSGENRSNAVELASASWDILEPGPVFSETDRGSVVTELTLSTYPLVNLMPRILNEFEYGDVVPRLLTLDGESIAFSEDALLEAPDAELDEADEDADWDDMRELLTDRLRDLLPGLRANARQSLEIVMESSAMRYDIRYDPAAKQFTLRIQRK